jgi:hypothetical protein
MTKARRPAPQKHPHPGKAGRELQVCGVAGCNSLQDTKYMDRVIIVVEAEDEPGVLQCATPLACSKHAEAFHNAIPLIKAVVDAAYAGQPTSVQVGTKALPSWGEPGW